MGPPPARSGATASGAIASGSITSGAITGGATIDSEQVVLITSALYDNFARQHGATTAALTTSTAAITSTAAALAVVAAVCATPVFAAIFAAPRTVQAKCKPAREGNVLIIQCQKMSC